jgi:hypothetical protein
VQIVRNCKKCQLMSNQRSVDVSRLDSFQRSWHFQSTASYSQSGCMSRVLVGWSARKYIFGESANEEPAHPPHNVDNEMDHR